MQDEKAIERRALTLAVVCVEQRIEALKKDRRTFPYSSLDGLNQQIDEEKQALRWLEKQRAAAYRS